jgi:alpha-tubulin suppressor-like RCC1 family protein
MWSWGRNNAGHLGLGNTTYYSSPKQIGALTTWLSISAGDVHNMAIKTDNTLWSWGSNGYGKLGLGNTANRSSPTQIGALTNWLTVGTGREHTLAISN